MTPKCWKCTLLRNPMMAALFAAVLFFLFGFSNEVFLESATFLFCCWLVGMVVFIVTPRRHYKLRYGEKELHLFFYDTYNKWKLDIQDVNRCAILRVFEKDGKTWRKSGYNLCVNGCDDNLLNSGFILVRIKYADWIIFGNDCNARVLGRRTAYYAFVSDNKNPKLNFIHGKKVITEEIISFEKCDKFMLEDGKTFYEEIEYTQLCTVPACDIAKKNGRFLFVLTKKHDFRLFKLVYEDGCAGVYRTFTDILHIFKKGKWRYFERTADGCYMPTTKNKS
ncbi:MAG: hypothetical protein NC218_11235 [Acetobacter sp.]|nr:hypothetical protein [Acetobacter sp.]